LIALFGRKDLNLGSLCNLTDGGEGTSGFVHSKEARAKLFLVNKGKNKGRVHSEETKAKMASSHKGRMKSDETRAKMSLTHKGHNKRKIQSQWSEESNQDQPTDAERS
jgi:hypothetical protein